MRIPYLATGFLSVVLALTLSSAAQNSNASPQPQPSAPASQGAVGQGATSAATPSQSTQSAPGQTSTTPGTTPGTAQSPAQTDAENPLNLTEEQKAKLRPILTDERQQMEAVRNDNSISMEQKMSKAQQIRETASPKIKAVLTPEQLKKLAEMQQKAQQEQNQSAPAAGAPPHQ